MICLPKFLKMLKITCIKCCLLATLFCNPFNLTAQDDVIVKYFDSFWVATSADKAFYFTNFEKKDTLYACTSYWMKSGKLNCKSFTSDTSFSKFVGTLLRYYENGQVQDSSIYSTNANPVIYNYHYYENGRLWAEYSMNTVTNKENTLGYDEKGKLIKNFIFSREAAFDGGQKLWIRYLQKNLKAEIPVKRGAPKGTYQVIVRFMVSTDGNIENAETETHFGYGMEMEALRVIQNSPKWTSAILLNKEVNAYRRQPITFVVEEK